LALLTILWLCSPQLPAADLPPHQRPDCERAFFPLPAAVGDVQAAKQHFASARQAALAGDSETAFQSLWLAHHANPADPLVRRALALPAQQVAQPLVRPGRGAPPILEWRPRTYLQAETPHFLIFSTADRATTARIAEQLERFYWVWTQIFFPLWEGRTDIRRGIQGGGGIGSGNERLQVVLFRDADSYVQSLQRHVPGVERSTGFYSDPQRCTFLFAGEGSDAATWQHELTHQLLREATRSKLRLPEMPGESAGFWLVEGIATFMESVRFAPTYALVGGWESPRLQYARFRWLAAGDRMTLAELMPDGRVAAQQRDDLARWYAHGAAYVHWLMEDQQAGGKAAVLAKLVELYQIPMLPGETTAAAPEIEADLATRKMQGYLRLDDTRLYPPDANIPLQAICLSRTDVTATGVARIPAQHTLQWLDMAYLPLDTAAVRRLLADGRSLEQLSLERTKIDDSLATLLESATQLRELDLSFNAISDRALEGLPAAAPLETVFLTGTQIGDVGLRRLAAHPPLLQIDVQQTQVTAATLEQLGREYPGVRFNPLQLVQR